MRKLITLILKSYDENLINRHKTHTKITHIRYRVSHVYVRMTELESETEKNALRQLFLGWTALVIYNSISPKLDYSQLRVRQLK